MKKEFVVKSMSCQHCVASIKSHFESLGFVVNIDLDKKLLVLEKDVIDEQFVKEELSDIGF